MNATDDTNAETDSGIELESVEEVPVEMTITIAIPTEVVNHAYQDYRESDSESADLMDFVVDRFSWEWDVEESGETDG